MGRPRADITDKPLTIAALHYRRSLHGRYVRIPHVSVAALAAMLMPQLSGDRWGLNIGLRHDRRDMWGW
ncbi:MAG: hypothetical protein ACJ72M_15485 [Propionibacteriaceae bacterium]